MNNLISTNRTLNYTPSSLNSTGKRIALENQQGKQELLRKNDQDYNYPLEESNMYRNSRKRVEDFQKDQNKFHSTREINQNDDLINRSLDWSSSFLKKPEAVGQKSSVSESLSLITPIQKKLISSDPKISKHLFTSQLKPNQNSKKLEKAATQIQQTPFQKLNALKSSVDFKHLIPKKNEGTMLDITATRVSLKMKDDNHLFYFGCREETCLAGAKKNIRGWECKSCKRTFDKPILRYCLKLTLQTSKEKLDAIAFDKIGKALFSQKTAQQLKDSLQKNREKTMNEILRKLDRKSVV